jgi:hypothetical protein
MEFKIDDLLAKRSKLSELALNSEVPKISDITDLILIIGPSRSGTTILHKILSSHPQINALSGEDSTYVKLFTGCEVNHDNFNDSLSHSPTSIVKGMNLLMSEIGKKSEDKMTPLDWLSRFSFQWPILFLQKPNNELFDIAQKYTNYENFLSFFNIDISLYENYTNTNQFTPEFIIEDPPFIFPTKRVYQSEKRNVLLLKASSNVYRLNELEKIFSHANIHFLYTNRNPEECINGLYDGWKSNGFHSYNIKNISLDIKEYKSNNWWKFDLPPNWNEHINSHLFEVCLFQWKSANEYALIHLKKHKFYTIKYHDLFKPTKLYAKLNSFLDKVDLQPLIAEYNIPKAMTTEQPQFERWKKRELEILKYTNNFETQKFKKEIMELPFENN